MGKQLKLGELIDRSMTARQQAQVVTRLLATVRAELRAQNEARQKTRRSTVARRKARGGLTVTALRRRRLAGLDAPELVELAPSELPGRFVPAGGPLRPLAPLSPDEAAVAHARGELGRMNLGALPSDIETASRLDRYAARVATHAPGRAAYWAITGPAPDCEPGDVQTAMLFYRKVLTAIEQGGWTHSERAALYDLERKWGLRARGEDPRFMIAGTATGRLPRAMEAQINEARDAMARGDR
jgi:hypothetical protein